MSYAERHTVTVTTATGGGGTGYTDEPVTGRVAAIIYAADGTTPFASTADVTVTTEESGQTLWQQSNVTASATRRPVAVANLPSGADSTISEAPIYAANERVKVEVAQGGNTKTGTFTVIVA